MERSQPIEYADLMSSGDKEQVRLEPRSTTASGAERPFIRKQHLATDKEMSGGGVSSLLMLVFGLNIL